jgi:hypothetical protein
MAGLGFTTGRRPFDDKARHRSCGHARFSQPGAHLATPRKADTLKRTGSAAGPIIRAQRTAPE